MKKLVVFLLMTGMLMPRLLIAEGNESDKDKHTISGHVKDSESGEDLIGATIYIEELRSGTVTNAYGFYSIRLDQGAYTMKFSYIGYQSVVRKIELTEDITLNLELDPSDQQLQEVEITGEAPDKNVKQAEMSVVKLDSKTIRQIPSLMGEVDIIKALLLLPGVQSAAEGSSGFVVRGGSTDQNLVLLDEAPVYNAGHLMGFFSVFNNDAIKDVKLYKGDIPARFGGRLSSVLDVRMKDGNSKKFSGTGGIGIISSRLTLEGPILKDRTSFIVSGRRTYADLFLPFSPDEDMRKSKMYFYDLNAKVNHTINDRDRIYLSGYFGRDVFKNPFAEMVLGNTTGTFRWNHLFSQQLFSNFSVIYSKYKYRLGTASDEEANSFDWESDLEDIGFKGDLTYYLNNNNTVRFGVSGIYHTFNPGIARGKGDNSMFDEWVLPKNHAIESAVYISNEQKIGSLLTIKYGLRLSSFSSIGPGTVYNFDNNFEKIDSTVYESGKIYQTYWGLEPRIGINYLLNESSSVKASYARTKQYLQVAQNSTAGTPLDIWFPASPNVKPQISDQFALGYFRNFKSNLIETSIEGYYKLMDNAIDFKDHAELLLNKELEGELRFGHAWSYGLETLLRLNGLPLVNGKVSGWVSYTWSRTWREFPDINNGKKYPAPYDRPHDVSIVANWDISKRWTVAANWVYATGQPVTFPTGRAVIGGVILPIYSDRNAYRMEDYHRLDVSATLHGKDKPGRKWQHSWTLAVYNAYDRHNTWAINFLQESSDPGNPSASYETYAEKTYLFGIIPSIIFNFKF
ncbi:MAG: TonB-dependent receptor [Bacteroidota bacterium]